jgi:MFS family permease
MVAASGGLLTPLLAYWLSRISGRGQGTELGLQTAAVSLGLSVGALAPGALAGFAVLPQAWVVLSVVALAAAAVASLRLPADLLRGIRTDQAGLGPIDIQDSHRGEAMIPCVPDRLIRSTRYGQAI